MVVIGSEGQILTQTMSWAGKSHHTGPVRGGAVHFAGNVQTDVEGRITYLDYFSGHYSHGPFQMKLLIDDLGGTESLHAVGVELSDVRHSWGAYGSIPLLRVDQFYRNCRFSEDTGNLVLLRVILEHHKALDYFKHDLTSYLHSLASTAFLFIHDQRAIRQMQAMDVENFNLKEIVDAFVSLLKAIPKERVAIDVKFRLSSPFGKVKDYIFFPELKEAFYKRVEEEVLR